MSPSRFGGAQSKLIPVSSCSLNFAFAFVLGQFFVWVILAGLGSWGLARWDLRKEKRWWAERAEQEKVKVMA